MRTDLRYIFKCQNCGGIFYEKVKNPTRFDAESGFNIAVTEMEYAGRIGSQASVIVSTHRCAPGVYGCGRLVGCRFFGEEADSK